jgi:hypothetical protein
MTSDEQRLVGVYMHHPEQMLRHAITKALTLASCMVAAGGGKKKALLTVTSDPKLCERAAGIVLRVMLRELVAKNMPSKVSMERLINEVADLARES